MRCKDSFYVVLRGKLHHSWTPLQVQDGLHIQAKVVVATFFVTSSAHMTMLVIIKAVKVLVLTIRPFYIT